MRRAPPSPGCARPAIDAARRRGLDRWPPGRGAPGGVGGCEGPVAMKLVVHYGKPKTGTTALQHALYHARRALAAEGVLYPASQRPREDHRILTALFRTPQAINPNVLKPFGGDPGRTARAARALFDDIRRQVDRTRPAVLVLSSEYFYDTPTAASQERFRDLLAGLSADIEICIYFREPAEQYLSGLQQALKNGGRRPAAATDRGPREGRADRERVRPADGRRASPTRTHLLGGDIVRDFGERFLGRRSAARPPSPPSASTRRSPPRRWRSSIATAAGAIPPPGGNRSPTASG